MKRLFILLLLLSSLSSCQKDDVAPLTSNSLAGTWRLIARQCFCFPAPLPLETLTFTDSTYQFAGSSRTLFASGHYIKAPVIICGLAAPAPGLQLLDARANIAPLHVQAMLRNDTLVLDYGSPCDAPRNTYKRVE